jgi:hypothetical protein
MESRHPWNLREGVVLFAAIIAIGLATWPEPVCLINDASPVQPSVVTAITHTLYQRSAQTVVVTTKLHITDAQYFWNYGTDCGFNVSFNRTSMKLLSLNCQSWNTAKTSVNSVVDENDIDILCLSETWESKTKPVKFRNWPAICRPRTGDDNHGGVAILYKPTDYIFVQRRVDLERQDTEVICAEVSMQCGLSFLLLSVYIPPDKHIEQLEGLLDIIEKANYKNIVITGDINAKSQEWGNK